MPETQSNVATQLECLAQGIQYHNEKAVLSKEMNAIAKACSDECGIDKKTIIKVKDYLYYRGRGWGEDCLTKSEKQEKYPDRVSPTFRKLVDIITNCYATGKESLLKVYLDAVKAKGITITVDTSCFTLPNDDVKQKIATAISAMSPIQCVICEKNDFMNDVLAEEAENTNLSPKDKYKQIVKLAASKQAGRDVDDKMQDEYAKVELFTNGLNTVNDIH